MSKSLGSFAQVKYGTDIDTHWFQQDFNPLLDRFTSHGSNESNMSDLKLRASTALACIDSAKLANMNNIYKKFQEMMETTTQENKENIVNQLELRCKQDLAKIQNNTNNTKEQSSRKYNDRQRQKRKTQIREIIREASSTPFVKSKHNLNNDIKEQHTKTFQGSPQQHAVDTSFALLSQVWGMLNNETGEKLYDMMGKNKDAGQLLKLINKLDNNKHLLPFYQLFGDDVKGNTNIYDVIENTELKNQVDNVSIDEYYRRLTTLFPLLKIKTFKDVDGFENIIGKNAQNLFKSALKKRQKDVVIFQINRFWNDWYRKYINNMHGGENDESSDESSDDESTDDDDIENTIKYLEPDMSSVASNPKKLFDDEIVMRYLLAAFVNGELDAKKCKMLSTPRSRRRLFYKIID